MRRPITSSAFALAIFVLLACSSPTGTSTDDMIGKYVSSRFDITADGTTTNLIDAGGTLTIFLQADGTSGGTLYIPAGVAGFDDVVEANLDGTWTLSDGTVTFDHSADTFVREMEFRILPNQQLEGDETIDGRRIRVLLAYVPLGFPGGHP